MAIIYDRKTGEARRCEPVDAREILASAPELYSAGPVELEAAAPAAESTEDAVVEASDDFTDWQSWHWKTKVKRAKELTGRDDVTPDAANDILAAEAVRLAAQDA